jgi:hypothetical protein
MVMISSLGSPPATEIGSFPERYYPLWRFPFSLGEKLEGETNEFIIRE